jgi:hypothetical protein
MLTPTVGHLPKSPDDARDLRVAIRLLAGKDCLRDPSEAQKMLLQIAEGPDKMAAADALAILQRAVKQGWLEDETPLYSELERLAERTLNRKPGLTESKVAVLTGLVVLALLGGVFFATQTDVELPWLMIGVATLIVVLGFIALVIKQKT